MRGLSEFKPPKPNRAVIWLCETLLPLYVRVVENLSFKFLENPAHPLNFLKNKSVVVVMNHGDRQDPLVVVALAKHMRETFYCVVAREVFDWNHGMLGWLFQKLGCYSVNRGVADFRSIHTTHEILTHSHTKLIVFPEAEITGDEQRIHHFNPSFIHLLLESQDDLAKGEEKESIWVLPVGITYRLETSLESSVSGKLRTIESRLGIINSDQKDIETRVTDAVNSIMLSLSRDNQCSLPEQEPLHERVRLLARRICERIGEYSHFEDEEPQSEEQLLYLLRNHVTRELAARNSEISYQQRLLRGFTRIYNEFLQDLDRVERLLILRRILKRRTSPIQICRILDFLEAETCGRMTKKGKQCASVFLGKPIEVLPFMEEYKACKDSAINQLTDCIRSELQNAFDNSHQDQHLARQSCGSKTFLA